MQEDYSFAVGVFIIGIIIGAAIGYQPYYELSLPNIGKVSFADETSAKKACDYFGGTIDNTCEGYWCKLPRKD